MRLISTTTVFACYSKACAPPPAGSGGSLPVPRAQSVDRLRSVAEDAGWKVSLATSSRRSDSRYLTLEKRFDGALVKLQVRMSDHAAPGYLSPSDLNVHYDTPYSSRRHGRSMSVDDAADYLSRFRPEPSRLPQRASADEGRRRMVEKARKVVANPRRYQPEKVRRSQEILDRFDSGD